MMRYDLVRDKKDERDYRFELNPHEAVVLPKQIDLRSQCPSVYDQGAEGSCTANAGCAARVMLLNRLDLMLSRAFIYYQARAIEGMTNEDSGASLRDLCKAQQTYGICEEQFMPYVVGDYRRAPTEEAINNALNYKIKTYTRLNNIDEIKKSLALNQKPVLMGMYVYAELQSEEAAKTGYIPMPAEEERVLGGHAVLIVGYIEPTEVVKKCFLRKTKISTPGYLIVRNSWGEDWGDKGYFYLTYEYFNKYTFDYWTIS